MYMSNMLESSQMSKHKSAHDLSSIDKLETSTNRGVGCGECVAWTAVCQGCGEFGNYFGQDIK